MLSAPSHHSCVVVVGVMVGDIQSIQFVYVIYIEYLADMGQW